MATLEQMEKKRSRQIEEILAVVGGLLVEVTYLRSEISEMKDTLAAISKPAATPRRPKK